jgi:hypothetical protein
MTLEILDAMTRPDVDGRPSLPRWSGPKGLLPSTLIERTCGSPTWTSPFFSP